MRNHAGRQHVAVVFATVAIIAVAAPSAQDAAIPGPGSGLHAVPTPPLDAAERAVVDQLRGAERQLREAIAQRARGRTLAVAYGAFAELLHAYEIFDSAEPAYLNAIRLAPGEPRWPYLLGYLYQQTGRFEDAIPQFISVQAQKPERREASARLADVYLRANRLRDAREQFRALVDAFPAYARNGLGEIALREGRFDEAIGYFRAALERAPQATSLHYSMAMAYRGLGRMQQAQLELAQRGPGTIKLGDPAVESLGALVRGERLLVIQGRRALDAGDPHVAADLFAKAVAAAPGSVAARTNLAALLVQLGEPDNAIQQLEAVVALDPSDEEATLNLAILLSDRSRFRDAVAVLTRAHARSPASSRTATTLARLLAASPDVTVRDGATALALATRVYEAEPIPVHAETVALALAELHRCGEAMDWIKRAIAAAEQARDAVEATRLKGELGRYVGCR